MKKKEWTEIEMQYALFNWLEHRGRTLVLPNFTPRKWHECDLFSLTNALYFHEVEIKLTRSDFLADFEKREKHGVLAQRPLTKAERVWYDGVGHYHTFLNALPRTFCYACPAGLLHGPRDWPRSKEIPPYAGLIWVRRVEPSEATQWLPYSIEVVVKPPNLPAAKMSVEQVFGISHNLWARYARAWKGMAEGKIEALEDTSA